MPGVQYSALMVILLLAVAAVCFFVALAIDVWSWFDGQHYAAWLAGGLLAGVLASLIPAALGLRTTHRREP